MGPERSGILFLLLIFSVFINRNILNILGGVVGGILDTIFFKKAITAVHLTSLVLLVFGTFVGYWGGIITCRQVGFKQLEAYLSVICLLVASLFKLGSVISSTV